MGVSEAGGGLLDVGAGLGHRQRAALLHQAMQVHAFDVLHHEEVGVARLIGVLGPDDVRMVQLR